MSGASPRAQQDYERRAGVETEAQFAVGDGETAVSREETAWRRGRAAFTLVDVRGQQGRPGAALPRLALAQSIPWAALSPSLAGGETAPLTPPIGRPARA